MRFLIGLITAWIPALALAQAPFEIVIRGARIVDGSGAPWFYGDVAVQNGRIARITPPGMLASVDAKRRIDAKGLVLAPGFIDIQSHSREYLLEGDGRVIGKVSQGVTTEIMGEGTSNAPARTGPFAGERGFDAWLKAMLAHGASVNFGSYIGSGTLRAYVKNMAEGRLTPPELAELKQAVARAMEDGAFGIASALIYPPDSYQNTAELVEASKVAARYGGTYITHMRSEGDRLLEGLEEAIEIGKQAGIPVEIYHLKAAGKRNWNKLDAVIARVEKARAEGIDVQANMYPYTAGSTGLDSCFPPAMAADGKLLENLANPAMRTRIREEITRDAGDWENLCAASTPEGVLVLGLKKPENLKYAGQRLDAIARAQSKDWIDTAMDLVLSERQRVPTVYFMMSEENVKRQLALPWIKFSTDAGGPDPDNARTLTHPRSYGTYTRILGKYVRDEKALPLEDAIRKMTSAVALRLGLQDRGLLREGFAADLALFDPDKVAERGTYEKPHQVSAGMEHVFVNGVEVWAKGKHTGAKPGRIVRGPGYRGGDRPR
jgi:dihydroorotase/N-acyl-D-amino-acid deacylase